MVGAMENRQAARKIKPVQALASVRGSALDRSAVEALPRFRPAIVSRHNGGGASEAVRSWAEPWNEGGWHCRKAPPRSFLATLPTRQRFDLLVPRISPRAGGRVAVEENVVNARSIPDSVASGVDRMRTVPITVRIGKLDQPMRALLIGRWNHVVQLRCLYRLGSLGKIRSVFDD